MTTAQGQLSEDPEGDMPFRFVYGQVVHIVSEQVLAKHAPVTGRNRLALHGQNRILVCKPDSVAGKN